MWFHTKKIRRQVCLEPDLYVATRCHAFRSSCDVALASPIEQATAAMRCLGANSPEPRRPAVPGWHVSTQKTSSYNNRTSLTSWAHRGSLSKPRKLVLSSLPSPPPPFFFFADLRPPVSVSKVACLTSLYLLSTCMYHMFRHITFLGYNHMNSRASVFSRLTAIRTHHPISHVSLSEAPSQLRNTVFPSEGLLLSGQGGCSRRPYQG